ncbi:MAG: damage-inducible protein [Alphaproteobacteria bacterium]|nr:damage-inducible protein [Alphaproteobacteria bacterium]
MSMSRPLPVLAELRRRIRHLEGTHPDPADGRGPAVLPFGVAAIDRHLPGGGLALGRLHEIAGGDATTTDGAAATLFAAGILARLGGPVLWILAGHDLFAPALAQVGLAPERVIYVEAGEEKTVLLALEEGLRHAGLAGVVGEAARLPMKASRRLQLAAEGSGVTALVLRRFGQSSASGTSANGDDGASGELLQPSAATTRWRISALPSAPLPDIPPTVPGIGRARWRVELVRCRGGEGAAWTMEACDAQGCLAPDRLAVPARLADRPAAPAGSQQHLAAAG